MSDRVDPVNDALDPTPRVVTPREPSTASVVDDDELGDAHALTDPSLPSTIVWYVYRLDAPPAPGQRKLRPRYCAKYEGPLDLERLRTELGGGSYKVSGFVDNKAHTSGRLEIDGPRRSQEATPAPATSPASASDRLERVERMLEDVLRGGRQLTTAVRSDGGMSLENVAGVIELVDRLRGQSSPAVASNELLEMLKQGIAIGTARKGGGEAVDWGSVIEKAAPVFERVLAHLAAQRRTVAAPGGAAVASSAPATIPNDAGASRMLTFVEALAKGVTRRAHPGQLADAAAVLLNDDELAALRLMDVDMLQLELAPVLERFPILRTPEAQRFLSDFLVELNTDDEGEGDEGEHGARHD